MKTSTYINRSKYLIVPTNFSGFVNTESEVKENKSGKTTYWFYGYLKKHPEDRLCPICGERCVLIDHISVTYNHLPVFGNETILCITRNRYKCKSCNKSYFQKIPFATESKIRITVDLEKAILELLSTFRFSYRQISIMESVSEKVVRVVKEKYINKIKEANSNIVKWDETMTVTLYPKDN